MRGVFSYTFCDFGNQFDVMDIDGEEPVELFIADITKVCIVGLMVMCTISECMEGFGSIMPIFMLSNLYYRIILVW